MSKEKQEKIKSTRFSCRQTRKAVRQRICHEIGRQKSCGCTRHTNR